MPVENQKGVITCCNGQTYTKSEIMYRVYIWIIILSLLGLQISIESRTITGLVKGQLVDIHIFLCTVGGILLLGTMPAMSPKHINQKKTDGHSGLGFLGTILITVGTAVLCENAEHTYPYHSVAGFTCLIAVWIQFILGLTIFDKNLTKNDQLWWVKTMHIILGLTIIISVALCFIFGYGTVWFVWVFYFLGDPIEVYTKFAVCTAVLALLVLSIPLYKLIRRGIKYFRDST